MTKNSGSRQPLGDENREFSTQVALAKLTTPTETHSTEMQDCRTGQRCHVGAYCNSSNYSKYSSRVFDCYSYKIP